jgi:hypothetical protein
MIFRTLALCLRRQHVSKNKCLPCSEESYSLLFLDFVISTSPTDWDFTRPAVVRSAPLRLRLLDTYATLTSSLDVTVSMVRRKADCDGRSVKLVAVCLSVELTGCEEGPRRQGDRHCLRIAPSRLVIQGMITVGKGAENVRSAFHMSMLDHM